MSAQIIENNRPSARLARPSLLRIHWMEAKMELLKMMRLPAFVVPTLSFPLIFYVFFGIAFGRQSTGPMSMSTYLIATYGAFGVIGASLFGFGVAVAVERGQGWLQVKRASPMPLNEWVTPGPGTTHRTPGLPVLRAAPSAIAAAENSCVTRR